VPVHINLTVKNIDRSVAFYRGWLGFNASERSFPDGTVFVRDLDGTDLAFHEGVVGDISDTIHFGFRWSDSAQVRTLYEDLVRGNVAVTEFDDEPAIVSVKFRDPDGYQVEVYWERDD
jgi:catechol 2,3-dioxygenase-like lactoylglutathione lyase family enzyme